VVAATNRLDILDPALLRPGRFDRIVAIGEPDLEARKQILSIHMAGKPLADDVDLDKLADITHGYSGADLAAVANEAVMRTIRELVESDPEISDEAIDQAKIPMASFLEAVDKLDPAHRAGKPLRA